MAKIEMGKKYRTRGGLEAFVLYAQAPGDYPNIGYIIELNGQPRAESWDSEGRLSSSGEDSPDDIILVKEKKTLKVVVNIFTREGVPVAYFYPPRLYADVSAPRTRITCKEIEIEYVEGEGLDK